MNTDTWKKAKQLFHDVLERPAAERDAFLSVATAESEVLSEVRRLLDQHVDSRSFLETPAAALDPNLLSGEPKAAAMPSTIGPFRIINILGEGGMGVVYLAEQDSPRRTVALKVIRTGLASESMLRRFEHEAQTLARVQHPGIAQIYQAGTEGSGSARRPYFAMELVKGLPLLQYADTHHISIPDRLALFVKICDAVQHAHMKGVVHRDLKPGNILIDESGQPKVLDFGVARLTDSDIRAATVETDVGQIIGTVPYMSPEQIAGDPHDLDTRSDVYSLGVVLYELLAGRLPYDLERKSIIEAARLIREQAPVPLSSTSRLLRGDIHVIVSKALEKDKHRRFQSAADLSSDLSRYLRDEPISARPPSAIYQVRKFAARNKPLVIAASVVLLAIAGALAGVFYQRNLARRQAARATAINTFFIDMLKEASPERRHGQEMSVKEMLDVAATKLEEKPTGDAEIDEEIRGTLAQTYWQMGALDKAEPLLRATVERAEASLGAEHELTLECLNLLGLVLTQMGRTPEAGPFIERAYLARKHKSGDRNAATLTSMNNWARWLDSSGRPDEGLALMERASQLRADLLGPDDRKTLISQDNLGKVMLNHGRLDDAEKWMKLANDGFRRNLGENDPDTFASYQNLAELMRTRQNYPEAARYAGLAAEGRRRVLGMDARFTLYSINTQGRILMDLEKPAEAEPFLRESFDGIKRVSRPGEVFVAGWGAVLARCLIDLNRPEEAQAVLSDCEASAAAGVGDTSRVKKAIAEAYIKLYTVLNRPDDAAAWQAKLQAK